MNQYRQFEYSIQWGLIESGVYHMLLFLHQVALFAFITPELYGIIGALFSLLYMSVVLSDLGLESTLPIFFPSGIASKNHVKSILWTQCIPGLGLMIMLACITFWYGSRYTMTDGYSLGIMSALCITEGAKKIGKKLLALLFFNKELAIVEMCALIWYITCVWSCIISGVSIGLLHVFGPMLMSSLGSLMVILIILYRWYSTLDTVSTACTLDSRTLITQRFFNYITHLSHVFFSSNFLIPFFAVQFGAASAGGFKLISSLVSSLTIAFKKIFGGSAAALLAHMHHHDVDKKRHAFDVIIKRSWHGTLWCLAIFMLITTILTYSHSKAFTLFNYPLVLAYVVLTFSEYFFVAYEVFFITQRRSAHLTIISLLSLILIAGGLYTAQGASPLILISTLCVARACTFTLMTTAWFYLWREKPSIPTSDPTAST